MKGLIINMLIGILGLFLGMCAFAAVLIQLDTKWVMDWHWSLRRLIYDEEEEA